MAVNVLYEKGQEGKVLDMLVNYAKDNEANRAFAHCYCFSRFYTFGIDSGQAQCVVSQEVRS
jgi:hypothetical protein